MNIALPIGTSLLLAIIPCMPQGDEVDLFDLPFEELFAVRVVTAPSLIEATVLDAGASVTVVEREVWQRFGAQRTLDALRGIPGVYVTDSYGGTQVPTFRGFSSTVGFNGYAMLLDGVPLNVYGLGSPAWSSPDVALETLDSIEVVRGPGSSIYGSDAFGGVVALKSFSPDQDVIESRVEAGSFGYHSESFRVSHGLDDDWRLTFVGSNRRVSDASQAFRYTDSGSALPVDSEAARETDSWNTMAKLRHQGTELAWHHMSYDGSGFPGYAESVAAGFLNGTQSDFHASQDLFRISNEHQLTKDLILVTRAWFLDVDSVTSRPVNATGPITPSTVQVAGEVYEDRRAGAQVQIKKPFKNSNLQFVGGLGYDWMSNDFSGNGLLPAAALPASGEERSILNGFGQFDLATDERSWHFLFGGRYDYYSDFGAHVSPRLGVVHHPTPSSALKLLYGNAFRAPSTTEQSSIPGIVIGGGDDLKPEKVDTYELIWLQHAERSSYGLTAFFGQLKDGIRGIPTGGTPARRWGNAAEAESIGIELQGEYQWDHWRVAANYTWAEAKITEPAEDEVFYQSFPNEMLNLFTDWRDADLGLTVSMLNVVYDGFTSAQFPGVGSYLNNTELGTYWRTDLYVGRQFEAGGGNLEAFFRVVNLLDREDYLASPIGLEEGVQELGLSLVIGLQGSF